MVCSVCGEWGGLMVLDGKPCLECCKARQRAAHSGRCQCGRRARPEAELAPFGARGRRWIPCGRCLGTIRQTN